MDTHDITGNASIDLCFTKTTVIHDQTGVVWIKFKKVRDQISMNCNNEIYVIIREVSWLFQLLNNRYIIRALLCIRVRTLLVRKYARRGKCIRRQKVWPTGG